MSAKECVAYDGRSRVIHIRASTVKGFFASLNRTSIEDCTRYADWERLENGGDKMIMTKEAHEAILELQPQLLLRCKVDREIWAEVYTYGLPKIEGLDKLITMLVSMRNSWAELNSE